ncbi:hypothetical protein CP10139811_0814 [Chlamydia ibidis]|uniref:Uncharacterized protein n=1 Tax=Chlamydia ibidis TaxID=1405396 RepID=S7KKD8_9CHLA|nr:hypothetical protein CP10139811_0814 [Chlamydia ibidis]
MYKNNVKIFKKRQAKIDCAENQKIFCTFIEEKDYRINQL